MMDSSKLHHPADEALVGVSQYSKQQTQPGTTEQGEGGGNGGGGGKGMKRGWTRELFVGLLGAQGVFVYINFIFANFSGALLTTMALLAGIYTHCDCRVATFLLNALVQFVLMIVVAVSVAVEFPGFGAYQQHETLHSVSIGHVPLIFLFGVYSLYLAINEWLFPKSLPVETQGPLTQIGDAGSQTAHSEYMVKGTLAAENSHSPAYSTQQPIP
ncbi:unnamed protein product [Vitrella brassicaformis CCMP3155]|uniref:Uncharacterized protein n=2 Tax=Vitrella brassicaformis TaxID=1169539 RepID=A0A0G4EG20_VITBC|nr:unnamed protein product [Vitrella brassicaformis CCMP3155]|mmetsp:Transcript_35184/g.87384  ORF Transcript_35184/g.87384 Transcript_35184/m.87384 type:complete len:214 (+) Transcript_35184:41-682(+)|eukprot:CEL94331.1 unnamed protein product [Vitrella brassicaformis CCMP3155]